METNQNPTPFVLLYLCDKLVKETGEQWLWCCSGGCERSEYGPTPPPILSYFQCLPPSMYAFIVWWWWVQGRMMKLVVDVCLHRGRQ